MALKNRTIRYQAAIVQDDHLLLLKVHDRPTGKIFWLFPGGGREAGETEEQCVEREVLEETHLRVEVERFLFEVPDIPERGSSRLRTYLCRVRDGEARPGCEPEVDGDGHQTIRELGWFDFRQREAWDAMLNEEEITYHLLLRVRRELGFMRIDVSLAFIDDKSLVQRMMEFYQYDLSEFENNDLDSHACFGYSYLDHYWKEKERYPFIVRVDGKLAGFVLVNKHTYLPGNEWSIAEFFIMRKYRRRGVGKAVALHIFEQFHGKWEVREVEANAPAQRFWQKVIAEYTGGRYLEIRLNNELWNGPVQYFDNSV